MQQQQTVSKAEICRWLLKAVVLISSEEDAGGPGSSSPQVFLGVGAEATNGEMQPQPLHGINNTYIYLFTS
jgi:hypothetical protein